MNEHITLEDLEIEVRRSPRRKHVDLVVDRQGQIVVSVPDKLTSDEIYRICKEKKVWLYQKLGRKQDSLFDAESKKYVTGEGFYYLGRKYRLKLVYGSSKDDSAFQFRNSRFLLHADKAQQGHDLFIKWYTEHAQRWLDKKVDQLGVRVASHPTSVKVRDLGYRWGSCTKSERLYFHWRIILLPPERIEYLILHELVHLIEHSHSSDFYRRLSWACPNYKEHENWLRLHGDEYGL